MDNKISFGAKPLNNITIQKLCKKTGGYNPCNATFVQIDPVNKNDANAINQLSDIWNEERSSILNSIVVATNWMRVHYLNGNPSNIKIYALTTQQNNYNKLKPKKIIGLAEIREDNYPRNSILWHLTVNPKSRNVNSEITPEHIGTGSAILTSLKKIYDKINLASLSNKNTRKFYLSNGFIQYPFEKDYFYWHKNIFVRIYNYIKYKNEHRYKNI